MTISTTQGRLEVMAVAIPLCTPLRVPRVDVSGVSAAGGAWTDRTEGGVTDATLFTETASTITTSSSLVGVNSHYGVSGAELNWAEYAYEGTISVEDPTADAIGVTFFSRSNDSSQVFYLLSSDPDAGTPGNFMLSSKGYVAAFSGSVDTGVAPLGGFDYRFIVHVSNETTHNRIRVKIFGGDTVEPAGWQIDVNDTSASRPLAGGVGVWSGV